jgi:hypothetical protein
MLTCSSLIDAAPRGVGYLRSVAATFNLAITPDGAFSLALEREFPGAPLSWWDNGSSWP